MSNKTVEAYAAFRPPPTAQCDSGSPGRVSLFPFFETSIFFKLLVAGLALRRLSIRKRRGGEGGSEFWAAGAEARKDMLHGCWNMSCSWSLSRSSIAAERSNKAEAFGCFLADMSLITAYVSGNRLQASHRKHKDSCWKSFTKSFSVLCMLAACLQRVAREANACLSSQTSSACSRKFRVASQHSPQEYRVTPAARKMIHPASL